MSHRYKWSQSVESPFQILSVLSGVVPTGLELYQISIELLKILSVILQEVLTAVLVGKTQSNISIPSAQQTTKSTGKLK